MRCRLLVGLAAAVAGLACRESSVSGPREIAPGHLTLHGEIAFQASGAPVFKDKAVIPATFAVALVDSAAGAYILAFDEHGAGTGDFFVLRLDAVRTGSFSPCADGPSTVYPDGSVLTLAGACQVRLLEGVKPAGEMVFSSRSFLRSVGGSVLVQSAGERLVGSVANLKLVGSRSDTSSAASVTIAAGEFDLPLLRGDAARAVSACFLSTAVGRQCGL